MGRLTDLDVHALTRPGWYGDGNTLYLVVAPRGSKSWVQRIGIRGRRHDLGLGPFPKVCVAEARERAIANRVAVRNGRDIAAEKKRALTLPTFEEAARRVHKLYRPSWTNEVIRDVSSEDLLRVNIQGNPTSETARITLERSL